MGAHLSLSPFRGCEDADWFAAALAPGCFGKEDVPRQTLEQARSFLTTNPRADPRGSYLAWNAGTVVGIRAFKSAPDNAGAVEIAYGVLPASEGSGFAKGMIAALFALAVRSRARVILARTLARHEGFCFAAEATDPEHGLVWSWEKGTPFPLREDWKRCDVILLSFHASKC